LPGQALRLPARPDERVAEPRPDGGGALRSLVPLGARAPAPAPGQPRGLLRRAVRLASLSTLLQDVHREGLGSPGHRALGRLGRPAREGSLTRARDVGGTEAEAA